MRGAKPMDPQAERRWWLRAETGLLAAAFVACVAAIRQDLPWGVNVDEPGWVPVAVRLASSGDLSPHWFGHPGSTVIYPLALISHLWHAWTQGGRLLGADPALWIHFQEAPAAYYVLGRLLAIAYLLLAMGLTMRVGRRLGGRAMGLVAAAVLPLSALLISYAVMVRSDTAGVCFMALIALAFLRLAERGDRRSAVLAGLAVGLGISTRYFLAVQALPLALLAWRPPRRGPAGPGADAGTPPRDHGRVGRVAVALLAAAGAFLASTPFALREPEVLRLNLAMEARGTSLGADGLGPLGNLAWYLEQGLPRLLPWPLLLLGLAGLVLLSRRAWGVPGSWVVGAGALLHLLASCALPLHWDRWLLQLLPALGLGAAASLCCAWRAVAEHWGRRPWTWALASVALLTLLVAAARPAAERLGQLRQPGSRAAATRWLATELRPGERVLTEDFGPYAFGEDMRAGYGPAHWDHWRAFAGGKAKRLPRLGAAAAEGRLETADDGYVVLSSFVYGPVLAEPRRFPGEADFYRRALDCVPAASFGSRDGPELRILRGGDLAACLDRSVAVERTPNAASGAGGVSP
jgi:hypothetical protein